MAEEGVEGPETVLFFSLFSRSLHHGFYAVGDKHRGKAPPPVHIIGGH